LEDAMRGVRGLESVFERYYANKARNYWMKLEGTVKFSQLTRKAGNWFTPTARRAQILKEIGVDFGKLVFWRAEQKSQAVSRCKRGTWIRN
jgi:hypothetical protein